MRKRTNSNAPTVDVKKLQEEARQGLQAAREKLNTALDTVVISGREENAKVLRPEDIGRVIGEAAQEKTDQIRQRAEQAGAFLKETKQFKKLKEEGQRLGENPQAYAVAKLIQSRESRLTAEAAAKPNPLQRLIATTAGKIVKTGVEMIPSPIGYGPGDAVSLIIGAVGLRTGKDFTTGQPLDKVDATTHIVAGLIPFVPATPFVEIAKNGRKKLENAAYAVSQGEHAKAAREARGVLTTAKDAVNLVRTSLPSKT